jgi:hypothetical protein
LTLQPIGDIQPGVYNWNLLAELYGTVNGKENANRITNSTASGTLSYGGSSRRLLRQPQDEFLRRLRKSTFSSHRALVKARYRDTAKAFERGNLCHKLIGSKTGCAIDLGHGYTLDAHIFPVEI